MPFYEYECSSCKFYSEVMQKITDPPMKKCPSCGKNTMKKLVSAPVFRLKGGGWYETDFKSDKEEKRNLAVDKPAESTPAEAGTEPKAAEAKPAEAKPAEPKASEPKRTGAGKRKTIASSRKGTKSARPAKAKTRSRRKARR
jgi:putative FmdB family regulatory protein